MSFRVTNAFLLRIETDRMEQILTKRDISMEPDGSPRMWDEQDFISHLASIGLIYQNAQLVAIRDELIVRGVLQ
jgi:hypothetical protein